MRQVLTRAWLVLQMSRIELGRLRSCKGANRKLLSRLNIVKRVSTHARPCLMLCQPGCREVPLQHTFAINQNRYT